MPSKLAENILIENLLSLNAVAFLTEEPLRLKSGLVTPIYVDNRKLITHPDAWHDVIETMASLIDKWGLEYDVIAGVEAGGLTHSAALAYRLNVPTIYVRQRAKTYGDLDRIEGGSVKGKRVLIIEDHIVLLGRHQDASRRRRYRDRLREHHQLRYDRNHRALQ